MGQPIRTIRKRGVVNKEIAASLKEMLETMYENRRIAQKKIEVAKSDESVE